MSNPSDCIATLRDAEYLAASPALNDAERATLLHSILTAIPEAYNRPWIDALRSSLERLYEPYRPAPARPTEGQQDAAEMAPGLGESATEAAEGPTSGSEEQTQDARRLVVGRHEFGATAEATAPAEGRKPSKTRK